jgi:hypothetical protein
MKVKSINRYNNPHYPTRGAFLQEGSVIGRYLPTVWKGKQAIISALVTFILVGCTKRYISSRDIVDQEEVIDDAYKSGAAKQRVVHVTKGSVAPVFVHGSGQGATGCIVISPPAFITEGAARMIIIEELKKEGIEIDIQDLKIEGIKKDIFRDCCIAGWEGVTGGDRWVLDGYSTKHNIGFEFVSASDHWELGMRRSMSTVQPYNFLQAARNMRNKLRLYGKINAGVFYDPCISTMEFTYGQAYTAPKGTHLEQEIANKLISQVHDFIEWLKNENIIENQSGE